MQPVAYLYNKSLLIMGREKFKQVTIHEALIKNRSLALQASS